MQARSSGWGQVAQSLVVQVAPPRLGAERGWEQQVLVEQLESAKAWVAAWAEEEGVE